MSNKNAIKKFVLQRKFCVILMIFQKGLAI